MENFHMYYYKCEGYALQWLARGTTTYPLNSRLAPTHLYMCSFDKSSNNRFTLSLQTWVSLLLSPAHYGQLRQHIHASIQ